MHTLRGEDRGGTRERTTIESEGVRRAGVWEIVKCHGVLRDFPIDPRFKLARQVHRIVRGTMRQKDMGKIAVTGRTTRNHGLITSKTRPRGRSLFRDGPEKSFGYIDIFKGFRQDVMRSSKGLTVPRCKLQFSRPNSRLQLSNTAFCDRHGVLPLYAHVFSRITHFKGGDFTIEVLSVVREILRTLFHQRQGLNADQLSAEEHKILKGCHRSYSLSAYSRQLIQLLLLRAAVKIHEKSQVSCLPRKPSVELKLCAVLPLSAFSFSVPIPE